MHFEGDNSLSGIGLAISREKTETVHKQHSEQSLVKVHLGLLNIQNGVEQIVSVLKYSASLRSAL